MIPSSPDQLSDQLDTEFIWRRREISFLKSAFELTRRDHRPAIGRACHVALYAHWEGFVREAGQIYLHHISARSLRFSEIAAGITLAANPNVFAKVRHGGGGPIECLMILKKLDELKETRFRNIKPEINTKSNLRYEVLQEIDCVLGDVGLADCVDKRRLDVGLVDKRNAIAHGRDIGSDFEEFAELVDKVTDWMQQIKITLVNAAVLKRYRIN